MGSIRKIRLAEILAEYVYRDTKYILRLLKPIKEVEDFRLYRFDDGTAGVEWRIGYLVRGGKAKELDYGHVIVSGERVLRDEPPISLVEELAFRNAKIGDVVVIHELTDMLGKDYRESLYYFVIDENLFERIRDKKKEIEDEQL